MRLGELIRWELYKLVTNATVLALAAVLLVSNVLVMETQILKEDEYGVSAPEIAAFYRENQGKFGEELLTLLEGDSSVLYMSLYEDISNQVNYQDYLDQILAQSERVLSSSVLSATGTYAHREVKQSYAAYQRLTDLELTPADPTGIENLSQNTGTLYLLLFLTILVGIQIYAAERSDGQLQMLRTAKNGKWVLFSAKAITYLLFVTGMLCLFWLENLLICKGYGLTMGDLLRPLQGVNAWVNSPYRLTVLGYLALIFLLNLLLILLAAMLVMLFALACSWGMTVYLVTAILGGGEYLLYQMISSHNPLGFLHQLNLFSTVECAQWFQDYVSVNVAGYSIRLTWLSLLVLPILAALALLSSALLWRRPVLNMNLVAAKLPKIRRRHPLAWPANLAMHESGKLLLENWGALLLAALAVLQICSTAGIEYKYGATEYYYEQYSLTLAGELSQEKSDYVTAERTNFDTIQEQIQAWAARVESGEVSEDYAIFQMSELSDQEVMLSGFRLAEQQYRYLEEQAEDGYAVQYLNTQGYGLLLNDSNRDIGITAALYFFAIVLFSGIFAQEKRSNLVLLYACTDQGRRKVLRIKLIFAAVILLVAFAACWVPTFVRVSQIRAMTGWMQGARSLMQFSGAWRGFSILGWFTLIQLVRLISVFAATALVMFLSHRTGSQLETMAIALLTFVLPALLAWFGLLDELPWVKLMTGHAFLTLS